MLRKLLFVSLVVATLASCKKDNNDAPAYNLSAKVDGTNVDFNTAVSATRSGDDVVVMGLGGNASSPYPSFSIFLGDGAAITAKAYTAVDGDATIMYAVSSGQATYSSDDDFTVTVSSITATEVKGTFSGKVENGSEIKTITEGTFTAKFQ
jgi:hypothetical protein